MGKNTSKFFMETLETRAKDTKKTKIFEHCSMLQYVVVLACLGSGFSIGFPIERTTVPLAFPASSSLGSKAGTSSLLGVSCGRNVL